MRFGSHQKGITLLGFVMLLSVLGFFAFIIMRLFPVYAEARSVKADLEGLKAEPNSAKMSPAQIWNRLERRFQISYVESVKAEHVTFDRKNGYNVTIKYEVRRPMMYNIDFVAMFEYKENFAAP